MLEAFSSILVLIVFLVPGFVWRTVEGQFVFLDKRLEWNKFALGLLARSTAVYTLAGAVIYHACKDQWLDTYPVYSTLFALCVIGVAPTVLGFACGLVRQKGAIPWLIKRLHLRTFEAHQIPTAWDFVFSRIPRCWAIVTLQDGSKLYCFVGPASYFSSDPEARDLYISHVLRPGADGKMMPVANTGGVYINKDRISLIEFVSL